MSNKEIPPSELPTEVPDRDSHESPRPMSIRMPSAPSAPSDGPWGDAVVEAPALSVISYITCPTCNTTYAKGDDHNCG